MPITTPFKGLCHFFVLIFAVFGPILRYTENEMVA
jgi:hypothetical protein